MRRRRIPRRVRGPGLPWKSFFALVGGLFLVIVVFGVGLDFVGDRVSLRAALIAREQSVLLDEVSRIEERNSRLLERVAGLERAQQIDREAQLQLQRSYQARQKENSALKAELAFYKTVIDPEKRHKGVYIHSVRIRSASVDGEFAYKIVVSQTQNKRLRTEKGVINFSLEGLGGGKPKKLGFKQVSTADSRKLTYSFKYFQSLEGSLRLPEGFEPLQLVLSTTAKGSKTRGSEYTFPWSLTEALASKGD